MKHNKNYIKKIGPSLALHSLKFPYRTMLDSIGNKLKFIHPDVFSWMAFFLSLLIGIFYYKSGSIHIFLIINIVLIILRMTLNTLDGLIALKINRTSMKGKLVNALPDRYADIFILAGISFSSLCDLRIGMLASLSVLLVSYSGMLGKAIGVSWQQHGPLDKVDRLVLIIIASFAQFIVMKMGYFRFKIFCLEFTLIEYFMILFIILAQITIINRTIGMVREINIKEQKNK